MENKVKDQSLERETSQTFNQSCSNQSISDKKPLYWDDDYINQYLMDDAVKIINEIKIQNQNEMFKRKLQNKNKQIINKQLQLDTENQYSKQKIKLIKELVNSERLKFLNYQNTNFYQNFVNQVSDQLKSQKQLENNKIVFDDQEMIERAIKISQKKRIKDFFIQKVIENKRNEIEENNQVLQKQLIQQLQGDFIEEEKIIKDADLFGSDEIDNENNQSKQTILDLKNIKSQFELSKNQQSNSNIQTNKNKNEIYLDFNSQINFLNQSQESIKSSQLQEIKNQSENLKADSTKDSNNVIKNSELFDFKNVYSNKNEKQYNQFSHIQTPLSINQKSDPSFNNSTQQINFNSIHNLQNSKKKQSEKDIKSIIGNQFSQTQSQNKDSHQNANDQVENLLQKLKDKKEFLPYISERTSTGRTKIESVQNLVTKIGAKNFVDRITQKGKKNYKIKAINQLQKSGLKAIGIILDQGQTIYSKKSNIQPSEYSNIRIKNQVFQNEIIKEREQEDDSSLKSKNIQNSNDSLQTPMNLHNDQNLENFEQMIINNEQTQNIQKKPLKLSKLLSNRLKLKINSEDKIKLSSRQNTIEDPYQDNDENCVQRISNKIINDQSKNIYRRQIHQSQKNLDDSHFITNLKDSIEQEDQNFKNQYLGFEINHHNDHLQINDKIYENIKKLQDQFLNQIQQLQNNDEIDNLKLNKAQQNQFIQDLQDIKKQIQQHKNFLNLSEQEKNILKLIIKFEENNTKQDGKSKLLQQLNIDSDIANNASEENLALIKQVTKLILDRKLYQTQNMRKFILQQKNKQNLQAFKAPIQNQRNKNFSILQKVKSKNHSQLRDLKTEKKFLKDKFGNLIYPLKQTKNLYFENSQNLSTFQALSQTDLRLVNGMPDQWTYFKTKQTSPCSSDDSLNKFNENVLQKQSSLELRQSYKKIQIPRDQSQFRNYNLTSYLKTKEIENENFPHLFNNYENDQMSYIQNKNQNLQVIEQKLKNQQLQSEISNQQVKSIKLCKQNNQQKILNEINDLKNLDYDQILINNEKVQGRKIQFTFSKNEKIKENSSHLGENTYKQLENIHRENIQSKINHRERMMKMRREQVLQNDEHADIMKTINQYFSKDNIRPIVDLKETKELKDKYQWYCKYEKGLTTKNGQILQDSQIFNKFLNKKLSQYIINYKED